MEIQLQHALITGSVLSLILGAIVIGSMIYNARLWLQDYPKPIRDKVPPLTSSEKRGRMVVGTLVVLVLLGVLIFETIWLRSEAAGKLSFGTAYLHIFLILFIFNLFDALVLDLLILTLFKPKFAILPGMEGMEHLFNDYRKQLIDFLKGMVFCITASLPFALAAVL